MNQHLRHEFGRGLAEIGNGRRAMGGIEGGPVEILADDARRVRGPVEDRADLVLEQRAFLLDHDDEIEPLGEIAHGDRIERPHHADLEEAQAERRAVVAEAQVAERLQEILPRLAGRDDADRASAPSPTIRFSSLARA